MHFWNRKQCFWYVQCRHHWGNAPWRRPWQQCPQRSSSPPWCCLRLGAVGHWPPCAGDQTWRRSFSWGPGPCRFQDLHALWLRPWNRGLRVERWRAKKRKRVQRTDVNLNILKVTHLHNNYYQLNWWMQSILKSTRSLIINALYVLQFVVFETIA